MKLRNEGRTTYAYFAKRGRRLVVLFHGRGTTIYHESYPARKFLRRGFSVLLVEYPGYGIAARYTGSEDAYYSDGSAFIDFMRTAHGYRTRDITAWGYSMGTGVAAEMARRGKVSRLILLAPYTSITDMAARRTVPILPRFLIWDTFDTEAKASAIRCPVLLIHGSRDNTIPSSMSERLHERFAASRFIRIRRGTHRLFSYMSSGHWNTIHRFILDGAGSNCRP